MNDPTSANLTPPAPPAPPPSPEDKWKPKMPAGVLAAVQRADDLHKQAYTPEPPPGDKVDDPAAPPGAPPAAEATPPAPSQPAPQEPPPAPAPRDWERDFNAMKGRLEREQDNSKALAERLAGLESVIAAMRTEAPKQPEAPPARQKLITEDEEKDYGTDFLAIVGKKAREELSSELEEMKATVSYLKEGLGAVGQTIQRGSTERVYDDLAKAVPNWQQMNQDEGFKGWLSEVDPYAGKKRWDMLTEAFNRHDSPRVVNFFKGYLSEAAVTDPSNPPRAPAPSPAPNGAAQGKVPLASFAAPGRAGPAAPSSPADKPVYTRPQIAQFYRDMSAGKWKGREAEAAVHDADIIAAGREGRIR
jgi:hypothetical protein